MRIGLSSVRSLTGSQLSFLSARFRFVRLISDWPILTGQADWCSWAGWSGKSADLEII
jgi:hypothetical protein